MRLLFDENLSPALPRLLANVFPDSAHLRDRGLLGQPDNVIWEHAREHGFTLVSKDVDFERRSQLYGGPPRLIWLRIGNCSREQLLALIVANVDVIRGLEESMDEAILILS